MLLSKEKEIEQLPDDITELRQVREAELIRIHHLERSNEEILEALQAEEDSDLREALEDNKLALEQKHARIREIDTWIRQITTARASLETVAPKPPASEFPDGLTL
mmetsp:Transcript_109262/g.210046  ORF Transcript_109262/g.210046 Transcript_109262/m.210046 type:complete len:106 (-) Transcript_109262:12-329(-)